MAKRFIDTDLFRKPFMRSLEAPYKALWIYLLCECDHAGIWVVELDVAQIRMGLKLDPDKVIEKMGGAVVSIDGGSKWYLPDFVTFQYGTLNLANRVHQSVFDRLKRYGVDPNSSSQNKPLTSPFQGVKDKDKDKDKDTQEGKERATQVEKVDTVFDEFYASYPNKKAKGAALTAWAKLKAPERALCRPAIEAQVKASHFRGADGVDYIPHPASWLNARRWDDEVTEPKQLRTNGQAVKSQAERDAELDRIIDARYAGQ